MEEMTLKEWTLHFVKNKDLLHRTLTGFEEKEESILFHFKNKDCTYFILENLEESLFKLVKKKCFKSVVCLATKKNLGFFIKNWNKFKNNDGLSFVFVDASTNRRWIINPYVHNRVCDDSSLKLGLKSMFESTFHS